MHIVNHLAFGQIDERPLSSIDLILKILHGDVDTISLHDIFDTVRLTGSKVS